MKVSESIENFQKKTHPIASPITSSITSTNFTWGSGEERMYIHTRVCGRGIIFILTALVYSGYYNKVTHTWVTCKQQAFISHRNLASVEG